MRRGLALAVTLGAALAAPAFSAPAPKVHVIEMRNMAFGAAPSGLKAGDVIEWVNADIFRHTATARDKSFDVDLAPKKRARTVLKKAGAVSFYCRFHPGMTGQLQVRG
jgi:plastocyanin